MSTERDKDARAAMPMLLWCPECGARHVDGGEFATKLHHTHACQECGHVWRPAIEPTCGVRFLPRFKNADAEAPEMPEPAPVRDDERAKVKEACEEARREGRDAGMREAVDYVWRRRKDTSIHCQIERSTLESIRDGIASLISKTPAPAPDLAALQAERERCALECEKVGETREGLRSAMVAVSCAERIRALT